MNVRVYTEESKSWKPEKLYIREYTPGNLHKNWSQAYCVQTALNTGLLLGAASKKKLVLLGGAHHKVATPPPPPVVVKVPFFFVEKFFLLRIP